MSGTYARSEASVLERLNVRARDKVISVQPHGQRDDAGDEKDAIEHNWEEADAGRADDRQRNQTVGRMQVLHGGAEVDSTEDRVGQACHVHDDLEEVDETVRKLCRQVEFAELDGVLRGGELVKDDRVAPSGHAWV